jgi:sigma-E factor negative regulatory protein RseB
MVQPVAARGRPIDTRNESILMIVEHRTIKRLSLILSAGFLAMAGSAWAGPDDGMKLLKKMSLAADKLDYSGEFVHVKDGKISSMKIAHIGATGNAGSQQKLMSLDGSMREIIQQDDIVACILPDQGMGLREKRQARQLFKLNTSDKVGNIIEHYSVSHLGQARVANRNCEQVQVIPNDAYRYGYNLCIDSDNQLLLSSELADINGEILESYKFVSVNFDMVDVSEIRSETPPKTLSWMDDRPKDPGSEMEAEDDAQTWKVTTNHAGVELEHYIERVSPVMQAELTHLVLSDGLAQISVFVSPAEASANQSSASFSMGGLNSFTRKFNDHMITVIGEVPKETVTLIATHTEPY